MSIDVPERADLEQVRGRWRNAVAGVLSKSNRTDSAQLGDHPERLLDTQTADGFAIRALYTAFDELPEPPLPGQWPFVRGGDPLRDVHSGWKVAEAFPANGATADTNAAVLAALGEGVSALLIRVGESGVAPDRLTALLSGVYLNLAPDVRSRRSSRSHPGRPANVGFVRSPSTDRPSTTWARPRPPNSRPPSRPRWPTCGCSPNPGSW